MGEGKKFGAHESAIILYVRDMGEAMAYYTEKLLFRKLWDWGQPPSFGAVAFGKVEIFLSLGGQGNPGTWLCIFIDDVDSYYQEIKARGAEIIEPPENKPWGMREMLVRDPNQHVIRFGHGMPACEPKIPVERVDVSVRIEKRLAAVLEDLAAYKKMTAGETIEEMLLHSFEKVEEDGVASPHTEGTHEFIGEIKKKHEIDFDCHANYRFVEKSREG